MSLIDDVAKYKDRMFRIDESRRGLLKQKKGFKKTLAGLTRDFQKKHWLMKFLTCVAYKWRCFLANSDIQECEKKLKGIPERESSALKTLVLNASRKHMKSGDDKERLEILENRHSSLLELMEAMRSTFEAGERALKSIQDAVSSIENAKGMEALDLMTKSKAISLASSAQNSSASYATRHAREAIEQYELRLKEQRDLFNKPEHNMTIEYIDLAFDMFTDGGALDVIGSIASYFALSSTGSKLREAYDQILPVHEKLVLQKEKLQREIDEHETEMLSFKRKAREAIVPMLAKFDIAVTAEYAYNLEDLYSPSATVSE